MKVRARGWGGEGQDHEKDEGFPWPAPNPDRVARSLRVGWGAQVELRVGLLGASLGASLGVQPTRLQVYAPRL